MTGKFKDNVCVTADDMNIPTDSDHEFDIFSDLVMRATGKTPTHTRHYRLQRFRTSLVVI